MISFELTGEVIFRDRCDEGRTNAEAMKVELIGCYPLTPGSRESTKSHNITFLHGRRWPGCRLKDRSARQAVPRYDRCLFLGKRNRSKIHARAFNDQLSERVQRKVADLKKHTLTRTK